MECSHRFTYSLIFSVLFLCLYGSHRFATPKMTIQLDTSYSEPELASAELVDLRKLRLFSSIVPIEKEENEKSTEPTPSSLEQAFKV